MKVKEKKTKSNKIQIDLSQPFLITLFNSLFSENTLVDRKFFLKVQSFFKLIEIEDFKTNKSKVIYIDWILIFLEKYFKKNIKNKVHILEEIINSTKFKSELLEFVNSEDAQEVSNEDVSYLEEFMTLRLKWSYLYKEGKDLKNILEKIEYNDYDSFESIVNETTSIIENIYYKNQLIKIKSEEEKFDFSVKNDVLFKNAIESTYRNVTNPKNTIKTGIKRLNQLLNGGFQGGRSYCILTLPGKWKSGFLLNACMWALKYNQEIIPNDPTRIPTVVYISFENSRDETIERIASYLSDDPIGVDLKDYKLKDLIKKFKESSVFNGKLDFVFYYRKSKSINMQDVDSLMIELENTPVINKKTGNQELREVVFIVYDYMGRMLPIDNTKNSLHESIGEISDDICNYSKVKTIPSLTAHQLNREGDKRLENIGDDKLKGLKLGIQYVAGSRAIQDNFDYVFIIYPEDHYIDGVRYLLINCIKRRGKANLEKTYFYQPFENDMRLVEDINLAKSASLTDLETLTTNSDLVKYSKDNKRNKSQIKNLIDNSNNTLFEELD